MPPYGSVPPSGGPPRKNKTVPLIIGLVVLVVIVVGAVVLLTGGDDGRSEEEQAYVDAITDYILASQDESEGFTFEPEQAECFAGAAVDAIGMETLQEVATPEEIRASAGEAAEPLDPIDLNREQAEQVYDNTNGCVGYRELVVQSARTRGNLSDSQVACLEDVLTEDLVRDFMVANMLEDDEATNQAGEAMSAAAAPCEDA
ncbi:MAG TPA: hypothetical protein VIL48_12210 [Acidimicrobiales bacterium]